MDALVNVFELGGLTWGVKYGGMSAGTVRQSIEIFCLHIPCPMNLTVWLITLWISHMLKTQQQFNLSSTIKQHVVWMLQMYWS